MQSSGNLNLLSSNQQQSLFKLSSVQKLAQLTAEKIMNEYFHEAEEKNKYLGRRDGPNFKNYHDVIGMNQDQQRLAQGLIHRQNMLSTLINYHTIQVNIGNEIIQKSKETINILNSDN